MDVRCVHDGENPPLLLRRLHDPVADFIPHVPYSVVSLLQISLSEETLQKCAVDAMLRHPVEVSLHGLRVARREEERLRAVRIFQSWGGEQFRGRVFGRIRPDISVRTTASRDGVVEPV